MPACASPDETQSLRPPLQLCAISAIRRDDPQSWQGGQKQVLSQSVADEVFTGGDKEQFAKAQYATLPGWSYRNMWWVTHNSDGAIMARVLPYWCETINLPATATRATSTQPLSDSVM
jgi:hypothetical protein